MQQIGMKRLTIEQKQKTANSRVGTANANRQVRWLTPSSISPPRAICPISPRDRAFFCAVGFFSEYWSTNHVFVIHVTASPLPACRPPSPVNGRGKQGNLRRSHLWRSNCFSLPFTGDKGTLEAKQRPRERVEQGIRTACGAPAQRWPDAADHAPGRGNGVVNTGNAHRAHGDTRCENC